MSTTLIRLDNIEKIFYTEEVETHALSNISLTIDKGEYVSISGPSGCGKSTLLSLLGLLDTNTSGKYHLATHDVSDISKSERARIRNMEIGFIFQSFNLISDLNVEENVDLPLSYRKDLSKSQRQEMVQDALSKVDMSHRSKHFPSQLSGGERELYVDTIKTGQKAFDSFTFTFKLKGEDIFKSTNRPWPPNSHRTRHQDQYF